MDNTTLLHLIFWGWERKGVGANSRLGGYSNKYGTYKKSYTENFCAFPVIFNDPSLDGFKINYNCDKILKI